MLGKRFRRTTSMSHLGPGCDSAPSDTEVQGMQEFNTVCCTVPHKAVTQEEGCHDANFGGYADMVLDFDPAYKFSDTIFSESPTCEEQEQIPSPFQVLQTPPLVPYQMGLWTQQHMGFVPQMGPGKLHHMCVEASMSPVDFLDVCFYCKRRLRHERDIFIYRGDSAFCSEECRHRHISRDEKRSLRGANKRGGARASSSETAVAA